MPRITLPSKQADGEPNWVDVRDPDDFLAEDLFAIHAAVRVPSGEGTFSPRELEDDQINSFLSRAITGWSFPSPIPSQANMAAADKVIGRAMKARDWSSLKRQVRPLLDELEGDEREDPKAPLTSSPGSSSTS
jgi:rhodanese-related sulfurtransferase